VEAINLIRWPFGITIVYHFLVVPITIELSALVAGLQTAWVHPQEAPGGGRRERDRHS
jgi:cytochrome bd ubiquinol oxidase subunit I